MSAYQPAPMTKWERFWDEASMPWYVRPFKYALGQFLCACIILSFFVVPFMIGLFGYWVLGSLADSASR